VVRVYSDQNNNGVGRRQRRLGWRDYRHYDRWHPTPFPKRASGTSPPPIDLKQSGPSPPRRHAKTCWSRRGPGGQRLDAGCAEELFIDTQGPQVTNVQIHRRAETSTSRTESRKTPRKGRPRWSNSLTISIVDNPNRDTINFPDYVGPVGGRSPAAGRIPSSRATPAESLLSNRSIVTNNPTVNGQPATAHDPAHFRQPAA